MLYSVKMHSSQGGVHGVGGRHISGAERIVPEGKVEESVAAMLLRARTHQRGAASFMQVKVEEVPEESIQYCPVLPVHQITTRTKAEGRLAAGEELRRAGVSAQAVQAGLKLLEGLTDSMRGAMVVDAQSGVRLDQRQERGVRCSNMDATDTALYDRHMHQQGLGGDHPREALVLASKVAYGPGTVAELCWSDDPYYVTGYVASALYGYRRIPVMKERGSGIGGRVFFVRPGTDMKELINYLEEQVVMIQTGEALTC